MKTYSGINDNTPKNILLDTGAFFINFDLATDTYETAKAKLLGCTAGGAKFVFKPTYRIPKADGGTKSPVRGMKFLVSWEVSMGASMLEFKKEVYQNALGASVSSVTTINTKSYTKIEGSNVLEDSSYKDNITWIGTISGSDEPVIIQIFNALNEEGLNFEPKDSEDIVCELNFVGHSTVSTLDKPPFAIYYPNSITDTTPPTVAVSPIDGATAVAVSSNVVFTFNEAINSSTVNSANFMVMKASDGSIVAGTLTQSPDKLVVTFDPTASLTAATAYIAIVNTNVKDYSGNSLANNTIINFTTA
jgi:hypothetical protein